MKSIKNRNLIIIQLFPEEDVFTELKKVCNKYKIRSAIIISGIGQVKTVKIGYFKKKHDYYPKTFKKPLEILSLTGNICKQEDEYISHLHIVLGDEKKKSYGGHLIEGKISITAEIILLETKLDIKRRIDKKTGLSLLSLK
jgi:predicted DNA-binding protein with PD1-like motif